MIHEEDLTKEQNEFIDALEDEEKCRICADTANEYLNCTDELDEPCNLEEIMEGMFQNMLSQLFSIV